MTASMEQGDGDYYKLERGLLNGKQESFTDILKSSKVEVIDSSNSLASESNLGRLGKFLNRGKSDSAADGDSTMALRSGGGFGKLWTSKRNRRRLIYKNGECNVKNINIKKRRQRYLADIFTTLIDIKWRYSLALFVLAFVMSWLLFAFFWWLVCFSHGDFDPKNKGKDHWEPCVQNVFDFPTAFLFSIETQHTIGYGGRQTTSKCPLAVLLMMTQSVFGTVIQAIMTGLFFAKLSRPKKRAETLMFSKNAVICLRDGQLCLLVRVGDMRRSHIVEAHVSALLIKKRTTVEGEEMPLFQHRIQINDENGSGDLLLVWPVILEHRITPNSPFFDMGEDDFHSASFEMIIVLEGIVESTGMTAQVKTSYFPEEILWGYRFKRLMTYQKDNGAYIIDYSLFNATQKVELSKRSAKYLSLRKGSTNEDESSDDSNHSHCDETEDPLTGRPLGAPLSGMNGGGRMLRNYSYPYNDPTRLYSSSSYPPSSDRF